MQTQNYTAGQFYTKVVLASRGMEAEDRLHSRTFFVNILNMNAMDLMKICDIIENSAIMIEAFKQENHGASQQLHREANRALHNYLCGVSTFVDHSRNFMKEFYLGTRLNSEYEAEIQKRFNSSEYARFVRDLRNYITHRGLPDSKLELNMKRTEEKNSDQGTPVHVETQILYDVPEFLQWRGWKPPARRFLTQWPRTRMTLREIFEQHWEEMKKFNNWFESRFREHHEQDYVELDRLITRYEELKKSNLSTKSSAERTERNDLPDRNNPGS